MNKEMLINGEVVLLESFKKERGTVQFILNGKEYSFSKNMTKNYECILKNESKLTKVFYGGDHFVVENNDFWIKSNKYTPSKNKETEESMSVTPMPGRVLKIFFKEGEQVSKGDTIIVMEAMKMEHALKAPKDGVIKSIKCLENEQVSQGLELFEIGES